MICAQQLIAPENSSEHPRSVDRCFFAFSCAPSARPQPVRTDCVSASCAPITLITWPLTRRNVHRPAVEIPASNRTRRSGGRRLHRPQATAVGYEMGGHRDSIWPTPDPLAPTVPVRSSTDCSTLTAPIIHPACRQQRLEKERDLIFCRDIKWFDVRVRTVGVPVCNRGHVPPIEWFLHGVFEWTSSSRHRNTGSGDAWGQISEGRGGSKSVRRKCPIYSRRFAVRNLSIKIRLFVHKTKVY